MLIIAALVVERNPATRAMFLNEVYMMDGGLLNFLFCCFLWDIELESLFDWDDCDIEQKNGFDTEHIYFILMNRLVHGVRKIGSSAYCRRLTSDSYWWACLVAEMPHAVWLCGLSSSCQRVIKRWPKDITRLIQASTLEFLNLVEIWAQFVPSVADLPHCHLKIFSNDRTPVRDRSPKH